MMRISFLKKTRDFNVFLFAFFCFCMIIFHFIVLNTIVESNEFEEWQIHSEDY